MTEGLSLICFARLFRGRMGLPVHSAVLWSLAACAGAALCEAILSGTGVKARFAELRLPRGAPPLWAWSAVGGGYYLLFFFLMRSVLAGPFIPFWTPITLTLIAGLLIANASWNWIFFRKKDLWLSFVFFVPYLLLALTLATVLYRIRNPNLGWYALYPAYLVYATWWGYRVWHLNRGLS